MTLQQDLAAAIAKKAADTATLNNTLVPAAATTQTARTNAINADNVADQAVADMQATIIADQAEIDRIQALLNNVGRAIPGLWNDSKSISNGLALRRELGIPDSQPMHVRERIGAALDKSLINQALTPGVNWLRAVEIDPRIGGSSQGAYIDYHLAVTNPTHRARIAERAAECASFPPRSYCEINSEGNIVGHSKIGMTLAQRQTGSVEFGMYVAQKLRELGGSISIGASFITQMWNLPGGGIYGPPEAWLPDEYLALLDWVGVDYYSKAWTNVRRLPEDMLDAPLAWITAKGLPMQVTEFGAQEEQGSGANGTDGGIVKGDDYDNFFAYVKANPFNAGGNTGIIHAMFNTDTDEPNAPLIARWDPRTTPRAQAHFTTGIKDLTIWAAT